MIIRTGALMDEPNQHQQGTALLIALLALMVFSIIGSYLALIATAEIRVSDNFESHHRARSAALAGMNHGRALLKGIRFDDLLCGPDGIHDISPSYLVSARRHAFRMPVSWSVARVMDIMNPAPAILGLSDDGVVNTGRHAAGNGLVLIPLAGIPHVAANPNGTGTLTTGRYFVKVTDNSGDASELSFDPVDDPYVDGDGQIVLRSMGIARTLSAGPAGKYTNSAVVYEARLKRYSTFAVDAPVVIQSSAVSPAAAAVFSGSAFFIQGGPDASGIAIIDTSIPDGIAPAVDILSRLSQDQVFCVQGLGATSSIRDITPAVTAHVDKRLILDASHCWRFVRKSVPRFADSALQGQQTWMDGAPVPLGSYDPALLPSAPDQNPRVTLVDGDLFADGTLEGGGLMVVTGKATIRGHFKFNGLILVLGAGELDIGGSCAVSGGIFLAALSEVNGSPAWGTAKFSIGDNCRLQFDRTAIQAAVNLIPAVQLGCREITPIIDP